MDISITINGVDRTSSIHWSGFKIGYNVNQEVDTYDFSLRIPVPAAWQPSVAQEVVVQDGTDTIFAGRIQRIERSVAAAGLDTFTVSVSDYTADLEQHIVLARYQGETVQDIIDDLIADAALPFTTTNVDGTQVINTIAFNNITVAQAIQRLAEAVGYSWYVDFDKDIHFFAKEGELSPFALADDNGSYVYKTLELTDDLSQVRNVVTVRGGEYVSEEERTETLSGDGTRLQFGLINKFASLPVVEVASVAQDVGTEYLNPDDPYEVMWNFTEKYLRFTAGNAPASGTDNITVTQKVLVPIKVQVNDPASIATYGKRHFYIRDDSIESRAEAIKRAQVELTAYRNAIVEGRFETYQSGLRPGQTLTIQSTQRGIDESFVIQKVRLSMRSPQDGHYAVQFATLRTIGIIQYLQKQLAERSIKDGEDVTLLPLVTISDAAQFSDEVTDVSTTTPPYRYAPADPGDDDPASTYGKYNFSTYADAV